jgi:acid phosphatase (class A)
MWLLPQATFTLQAPPSDDMADAKRVKARQSERTPERMREIIAQIPGAVGDFFEAAGVVPTNCPAQTYFANAIVSDTADVVFSAKRRFSRLRPHEALPDVRPAIEVPWHASYPSGHATQARLLAQVFATWYPQKAAVFAALAQRVAQNREIAGLHYASDSAAGYALGDQLFLAYRQNPEVQGFLSRPCNANAMNTAVSGHEQRTYASLSAQAVARVQLRMGQWQTAGDERQHKLQMKRHYLGDAQND